MARAHYVKSSRKAHKCHKGHEIPVGEGYYWAAPGFRASRYGKKFACSKHPFRGSDLVSGLRSEPLRAIEDAVDALDGADTFDALEAIKDELESALEDYVSIRQEALDAWENGNSQLEEFVYTAEAARDEISQWSGNYSDSDEPDDDWLDDKHAELKEDGEKHTREDLIELWLQERLDEERDELRDVIEGIEV